MEGRNEDCGGTTCSKYEVQIAYHRRFKLKKGDFVDEANATTESDIEETLKKLVHKLKKSPEEVFDALKNQTVDLVFTAHPTQSVRKSLLQKHGRIRDCLLYVKDITPDDKHRNWMRLCIEKFTEFETVLVKGDPYVISLGNYQKAYIYKNKIRCCVALLANDDKSAFLKVNFENQHYNLPLWSFSILPGCKNTVYNTARVRKYIVYDLESIVS